jgi:hypothetical protein
LRQLRTIGSTINGQQLVYVVFSKWTNDETCLDGSLSFSECYHELKHLYKVYAKEVLYLRRKEIQLVRHGGSYNDRFQLSSDLLWRPDMDDGGVRLDGVEEAMDKALFILMDNGEKGYSREIGEKCWLELKSISNIGDTLAQQCIQMSARLGLSPVVYCEFATVDGSSYSKAGPTLLLRDTCPCRDVGCICQCSATATKNRFFAIVDSLKEHRLAVTDLICENTLCLEWRMSGKKDDRKPDLLFWDKYSDMNSFQNLIVYCSRKSKRHHRKLVMCYRGEWKALDEVIFYKTDLRFWSLNQDQTGFYEWKEPGWANGLVYPQQTVK